MKWMPKFKETFYFIDSVFVVNEKEWENSILDEVRREKGNCFQTREKAEIAAQLVKETVLDLRKEQPVTDCNQSPKLTVEVFDRPDCPEWAKYAAVDKNGDAYYFRQKPYINKAKNAWITNSIRNICWFFIDHNWDSSDWQHSLIERPSKSSFDKLLKNCAEQQVNKILQKARERRLPEQYHNGPEKENTLPNWCKVGEWVYDKAINRYSQVADEDITKGLQEICKYISKGEIVQARLRPYNADEMKALVGKVIEKGPSMHIVTGFENVFDNECMVHVNGCLYSANDLLQKGFTCDTRPCGRLEHLENGEWVE